MILKCTCNKDQRAIYYWLSTLIPPLSSYTTVRITFLMPCFIFKGTKRSSFTELHLVCSVEKRGGDGKGRDLGLHFKWKK